ncbi:TOBE domain-containing protein [Mesorhizobium sp. B2-5-7]|nr:TOBE domain-containing protein [Mesorhizobium sp. B2-5-7]
MHGCSAPASRRSQPCFWPAISASSRRAPTCSRARPAPCLPCGSTGGVRSRTVRPTELYKWREGSASVAGAAALPVSGTSSRHPRRARRRRRSSRRRSRGTGSLRGKVRLAEYTGAVTLLHVELDSGQTCLVSTIKDRPQSRTGARNRRRARPAGRTRASALLRPGRAGDLIRRAPAFYSAASAATSRRNGNASPMSGSSSSRAKRWPA